tara:strand:- start:7610 stop:8281 length:672 start_codon:yes stop_codon:yes gene_type:complete
MSVMAGFIIVMAEKIGRFWRRVHAVPFGVYGASQVGKTTLHHQLRTRGEVPDIHERTIGREKATRKVLKLEGDVHTVRTADIGGETVYWAEWIKDMKSRKVKYVIFMIDDRHMDKHYDIEQQLCWTFLTDTICSPYWDAINKKKRKKSYDYPIAVGIWANKYDLWKDKYTHNGEIGKHPIFTSFENGMQKLNDKGIPCYKYIVSAKSDSEMVYRGMITMIKDY